MVKAKRKLLANILAHFSWYTMVALVVGSFVLQENEMVNLPKLLIGMVLTLVWVLVAILVEPDDRELAEGTNE